MAWIQTSIFALLWLLISASNMQALLEARRQGGTTSLTLFIGGIFGVIAMLICPLPGMTAWCWVPALLDPGTGYALLTTARQLAKRRRNS